MNKFKVGDRINVYGQSVLLKISNYAAPYFTGETCKIIDIHPDGLTIKKGRRILGAHPKQCRKIKAKDPS